MGGPEKRSPMLSALLLHELGQLVGRNRIKTGGRLIQKHQRRLEHQQASQSDATLLAEAELVTGPLP